jgi:hypothetical protein
MVRAGRGGVAALWVALVCSGCATIRERRIVQVESATRVEGAVHHDPAKDQVAVRAKIEGDDALVAVGVEPTCTVEATDFRHLRVRYERTPEGLFNAELTTFIIAAAVFGVSAGVAASEQGPCAPRKSDDDSACANQILPATIAIASAGAGLVSGGMTGIDLLRSIDSTTTEDDQVVADPRALPCPDAVSRIPGRISILLPDGTERSATPSPDGSVTRIPLGDIRSQFPDGFTARIAVDGRVVGKLRYETAPP